MVNGDEGRAERASVRERDLLGVGAMHVARALLLFALNAVVARMAGASGFGVFSFALAVSAFLALLTTAGLPTGTMRYAAEYRATRQWDLLSGLLRRAGLIQLALSFGAAALLAAGALLLPLRPSIVDGLLGGAMLTPMVGLALWRTRALQGLGRIKRSFVPQDILLPAVASILILLVGGSDGFSFVLLFWGVYIGVEVVGAILLLRALPPPVRSARPAYRTRLWMRTSLPMAWGSLMQLGMNRFDLVLVGALAGMQSAGLFSAASRVALLGTFSLQVVDTLVAPKIAAAYASRRPDQLASIVRRGTLWAAAGALPLTVAMIAWPGPVLGIFGDEYAAAAPLLRILAIGQFLNAATGPVGFALLMAGQERLFAKVLSVASVATLSAHLVVIPIWGALGAAIVTASTVAITNFALLAFARATCLSANGSAPLVVSAPVLRGRENTA